MAFSLSPSRLGPIGRRRLHNFRSNKRGFWSLWIFLGLFLISLFAEFIANDKPLLISYDGAFYTPILERYAETTFGGEFESEADYTDPFVQDLIKEKGWMIWPIVPFSYDTHDFEVVGPSSPDARHWLGTDDQARDVVARVIYGFRLSVLFALCLTILASIIGIAAGAVQGYFGGWIDLLFQRFIEIWESLPILFILIIMAAVIQPSFFTLLFIMLLSAWTGLVGVVRAEFLRARNFDYVRAARALGVGDTAIMFRHVLPNAMVATLTFLPFSLAAGVTTLTGLDFLGFGLPAGSPSLGELLRQGKSNLQAPWLGLTAFMAVAILLSLLVFVGEAVRDAFDPRKLFAGDVPPEQVEPAPEQSEDQSGDAVDMEPPHRAKAVGEND